MKQTLPAWLAEYLPEPRPSITLSFDANKEVFLLGEEDFDSVEAAYDSLDQDLHPVYFDKSIDGHGGSLVNGFFFCDNKRLLLSLTDEDRIEMLVEDYKTWVEVTDATYQKNPNSFYDAYHWLQQHPAFWTAPRQEKTENKLTWVTDHGLKSMWMTVVEDKDKIKVWLEHGSHVGLESQHTTPYTHHYHDTRLDVTEETYEKAIIALAKNVNKYFATDGTERT